MKTLLKDMPEHMERIENNQFVKQDIVDILNGYEFEQENASMVADEILEKLTEFVNQNYTFKGI